MSDAAQIEALFFGALEKGTDAERIAYLESACGGDVELRRQVEKLLKAHPMVEDFLNRPAAEQFASPRVQSNAARQIENDSAGRLGQQESQLQSAGETVSMGPQATPTMELASGTRLGPYAILGPLGSGGMGHVYRARDVTLGRSVAVKVLRDEYDGDPAWLARFEREARMLAALNHPNIATVHGLDEANGLRYLVMELVSGQTLADRLTRGPLPLDEALAVCSQVAEAMEAAHERGIIHRDLKPANVMLTPEGRVKILDFGLAKGVENTVETDGPIEAQTSPGMVIGTPAYMSPEQARGKPLDRRCDVWAFGCVLFECLTGRRAFHGQTVADVLASVLSGEPDWEALPAGLPPRVVEMLRRCLQKDPRKRQRDAGDARLQLEEAITELGREPTTPLASPPSRGWWRWWPLLAVAAAATLAFALGIWNRAPTSREWSGQLLLGGSTRAFHPRLSPDGQWLAFVVIHEQQAQVGVMKLDTAEWWVLTRSRERGQVINVCWSPDSTRLYFDRFFDVPVGVYSVSPLDRNPEGARELLVVKDADSPQVVADGSLVVGKLDDEGNYRLNRLTANEAPRPVGPPIAFNLGWPSPMRALHTRNAVVFCGTVLDGKALLERRLYLLDLDRDEFHPLWERDIPLSFVPLAVSPRDDFAWTMLDAGDAYHVVRIPLTGRQRPEPVMTLTTPVWGMDVDATGEIFLDQIYRPLEVIRFAGPDPSAVERLAAPSMWRETGTIGGPLQLPDGRVVLPSKTAGRDRLLVAVPGKDPEPLLADSREESAPPATMVGPRRLAFVAGSGTDSRLRLATLDANGARLEPTDLGVAGQGLTALAATPDGRTLFYVQSRHVHEVSTDGLQTRKLEPGDGVAVNPTTGDLVIQRFEGGGIRFVRLPRPAGQRQEVKVQQGSSRLATVAIGAGAIDRDGRLLVASTTPDSWFWRPAVLSPNGELRPIPVAFDGDIYPAGWSKNDRVLGMGYSLRSELWRLRLMPPETKP
jgi:serine/threonine protein kinase